MKNPNIPDNIISVPLMDQYMSDMARYSLAVLFERFVPNILDGLKPVQRRVLYAMLHDVGCISLATKRKSAKTTGSTIASYHPHSCLRYGTKVKLLDNSIHDIGELFNNGITSFEALGINPNTLEVEPIVVHDLRVGQFTNQIYHVQFSNGTEIQCTSNHPFMMHDGMYKEAKDLQQDDDTMFIIDSTSEKCNNEIYVTNIWVEQVENEPMYDFTVDSTNNMLFPLIGPNNDINNYPMICLHNSDSCYCAMKCMTNWFECKLPLICYDSASGSIQGSPQAAERYTESYLSQFSMEVLLGDLIESKNVVDWFQTFDRHTYEPVALPVKVPLLLVNGTFGIAIGERVEIPSHSLDDVINTTIDLMHNPNTKVMLIPDPCQKCEIIVEDKELKQINNMGIGYYTERGIVETIVDPKTGETQLAIKSVPDLVWPNSIMEKVEELTKNNKLIQIADTKDYSTNDQLDIRLVLKKGSDPEYVKQVLYKNTQLQTRKRVNLQVITQNGPMLGLERMGYKAYILRFLEFRREVLFRLYNARLQKVETRLHTIDTYIRILESGDVDNIIKAIRNRTQADEAKLIEWLMNKLKITDLQAKFVLNTQLKALSRGSLNKYKEEQKTLQSKAAQYIQVLTKPELIDIEIEEQLKEIKAKYGKPRQSVIVSESEAANIPSGTFKLIIYDDGIVKKTAVEEAIKSVKGKSPKCICTVDNAKDIIIFDEMGKAFKLPVHKVPFSEKNSAGTDIRMILKKLTSRIVSAIYLPLIEELADKKSKYYLVVCTKNGMTKRIDLDDLINATPSGVIYTKLGKTDFVCDIVIAGSKSDVIMYTKTKALRTNISNIPYVKRSAIGNIGIRTDDTVEGLTVLGPNMMEVVAITFKGKANRIAQGSIPTSQTNRAGNKLIKLNKDDFLVGVFACTPDSIIRCLHSDGNSSDISVKDLPIQDTSSSGSKISVKSIVNANIIKL